MEIEVTNAGGSYSISPTALPDIVFIYATGAVTLGANFSIGVSGYPPVGTTIRYITQALDQVDLNGFTLAIEGTTYNEVELEHDFQVVYTVGDISTTGIGASFVPDLRQTNVLYGSTLVDGTVSLSKLESVTDGSLVAGGAGNVPTILSVAGVLTAVRSLSTLVFSFAAGSIVNAAISASAAIARSKLANGTASQVVINDGSGVLSSEAQLAASRGGTALDTSASTGFATVSAGAWTVGSISDVITLDVSFESGEVGDFKVKLPYACTVAEIYAYAYKVIAGTDAGTIVPKDNGGTTMTGGTITFAASDPRGTAYTSTPSANNTFTAGQLLTLTTAKTTAGGKVLVSVKVTRNL